MKFKVRRFVFLMVFAGVSAYLGSIDLKLFMVFIGGCGIGYIFHFEEKSYSLKQKGGQDYVQS